MFAKPSWLVKNQPRELNTWPVYSKGARDYSDVLAGPPVFTYTADSDPAKSLTLQFISADAGDVRPGDTVDLSGSFREATGRWIVRAVTIPLATTDAVEVECVRPVDPDPRKNG